MRIVEKQEHNKQILILDSAEKIFSQVGYDTATLDEIASGAGVAKGTIYLYFSNKQDLFISLIESRLEQFLTLIQNRLTPVKAVEDWLKLLIVTEVKFIKQHAGLIDPMFQSLVSRPLEFQERVRAIRKKLEVWISENFAKRVDANFNLDPQLTMNMIFGAVNSLVINKLETNQVLDADQLAVFVMNLVMPGINQNNN